MANFGPVDTSRSFTEKSSIHASKTDRNANLPTSLFIRSQSCPSHTCHDHLMETRAAKPVNSMYRFECQSSLLIASADDEITQILQRSSVQSSNISSRRMKARRVRASIANPIAKSIVLTKYHIKSQAQSEFASGSPLGLPVIKKRVESKGAKQVY